MRFLHRGQLVAVALLVMFAGFACATPSGPATEAAAEMSEPVTTGEILKAVNAINVGEIEHARLALDRSDDPEVREAAQLILQDHEALKQRVLNLAQTMNVSLEESPLSRGITLQARQIKDELDELHGDAFDSAFLERQVELHEISLELVRDDLMENARSAQIKSFLTETAAQLEQHLEAGRQRLSNRAGVAEQ